MSIQKHESSEPPDWSSLPITALENVIDNLSNVDLLRAIAVCKNWQHFIENDPNTARRLQHLACA